MNIQIITKDPNSEFALDPCPECGFGFDEGFDLVQIELEKDKVVVLHESCAKIYTKDKKRGGDR